MAFTGKVVLITGKLKIISEIFSIAIYYNKVLVLELVRKLQRN